MSHLVESVFPFSQPPSASSYRASRSSNPFANAPHDSSPFAAAATRAHFHFTSAAAAPNSTGLDFSEPADDACMLVEAAAAANGSSEGVWQTTPSATSAVQGTSAGFAAPAPTHSASTPLPMQPRHHHFHHQDSQDLQYSQPSLELQYMHFAQPLQYQQQQQEQQYGSQPVAATDGLHRIASSSHMSNATALSTAGNVTLAGLELLRYASGDLPQWRPNPLNASAPQTQHWPMAPARFRRSSTVTCLQQLAAVQGSSLLAGRPAGGSTVPLTATSLQQLPPLASPSHSASSSFLCAHDLLRAALPEVPPAAAGGAPGRYESIFTSDEDFAQYLCRTPLPDLLSKGVGSRLTYAALQVFEDEAEAAGPSWCPAAIRCWLRQAEAAGPPVELLLSAGSTGCASDGLEGFLSPARPQHTSATSGAASASLRESPHRTACVPIPSGTGCRLRQ